MSTEYSGPSYEWVRIYQGDEGKVVSVSPDRRFVQITVPSRKVSGVVPLSPAILEIGNTRHYGAEHTHVTTDDRVHLIVQVPQNMPATVSFLGRAAHYFLDALHQARPATTFDFNSWLSPVIQTLLDNPVERQGFVDAVIAGTVNAGTGGYFAAGSQFTVDDIIQDIAPVSTSRSHAPGIYFFSSRNFRGEPNKLPTAYIGKTTDMYNRFTLYRRQVTEFAAGRGDVYSVHIRHAHQAGIWDVYPICLLHNEDHQSLAEQFFTCLFQTYCPEVLRLNRGTITHRTDSAARALVAQGYDDAITAQRFRDIGISMAMFLTWTNSVLHPRFGCSQGTNWSSPLAEANLERRIWVVWNGTDRKFFMHTATLVTKDGLSGLTLKEPRNVRPASIPLTDSLRGHTVPAAAYKIPPGSKCWVQFEMMTNGQPHEVPFSILHNTDAWSDSPECRQLGCQVTWAEGNQWKSGYVQRPSYTGSPPLDPNVLASNASYRLASALSFYFRRQDPRPIPDWRIFFPVPKMKLMTFDHLRNEIRFTTINTPTTVVPAPTLVQNPLPTRAPLVKIPGLAARSSARPGRVTGFTKVGGEWGTFLFQEKLSRKMCDTCLCLQNFRGERPQREMTCKQLPPPNEARCPVCAAHNRDCTWTSTAILSDPANAYLVDMLIYPPVYISVARVIANPHLTTQT